MKVLNFSGNPNGANALPVGESSMGLITAVPFKSSLFNNVFDSKDGIGPCKLDEFKCISVRAVQSLNLEVEASPIVLTS